MSTGVTFGWYDYLMFAGILAISLTIGLGLGLAKGRQKTTKEYLFANRNLGAYTLCVYLVDYGLYWVRLTLQKLIIEY